MQERFALFACDAPLSTDATSARQGKIGDLFYSSACLLFQLETIPAGFYLLCMDASNRVNEVSSMYDDSVCCNVVYTPCHASVCSPIVGADFCSWPYTLGDYGIKCGDVPSVNDLEISPCRAKFGSDYAKYPSIPSSSPSVVLQRDVQFCYW